MTLGPMALVAPPLAPRAPIPEIDMRTLGRAMERYVVSVGCKKAFRLHSYHYLTKGRAVDARSLHAMFPLVDSQQKNISPLPPPATPSPSPFPE